MRVFAYVGARPLGRPLPPLGEAPQGCEACPLHLIYAFARDAAHDGRFAFYDEWQLEQAAAQQCGCQQGMLSLGGAGWAWAPAVPLDAWVANAADSLKAMLERYKLVGLDINYEDGLEDAAAAASWAQGMAALVAALKAWRPSLLVTVAPFGLVWPAYRQLLQLAGADVDYILWQLYAELEGPDSTAQQAVAEYERLAREVGGYSRLVLGVNTEPQELRGPCLEACLEALRVLRARGIGGAFVWALDNSPASGYASETALLCLAAEPAPPPALPVSTSAAVPGLHAPSQHSADGTPPAARPAADASPQAGCCCSLM